MDSFGSVNFNLALLSLGAGVKGHELLQDQEMQESILSVQVDLPAHHLPPQAALQTKKQPVLVGFT